MSYIPSYYSIDDIFVTHEKVPCQSLQIQRKMGFLDVGAESEDLKQQDIDLPLWYCLAIDSGRNSSFKTTVPEIYRTVYTDICKADSTVVQLGKMNRYFYEFGRYCSKFDRTGEVATMLFETCKTRMIFLKDICYNDKVADVKATHGFEFLEHELYKVGANQTQKFSHWLQDESNCNLLASQMALNHRKRRREDNENDDIL